MKNNLHISPRSVIQPKWRRHSIQILTQLLLGLLLFSLPTGKAVHIKIISQKLKSIIFGLGWYSHSQFHCIDLTLYKVIFRELLPQVEKRVLILSSISLSWSLWMPSQLKSTAVVDSSLRDTCLTTWKSDAEIVCRKKRETSRDFIIIIIIKFWFIR